MRGNEMNPKCFRCGRSAFATLKVEAAIGATRLEIRGGGGEMGICAPCMIDLADWLKRGHDIEQIDIGTGLWGLDRETLVRLAESHQRSSRTL
jgi:hypothetical protein